MTMLEQRACPANALSFFDALPPVNLDDMPGAWHGPNVSTGHPLDSMLKRFGWRGERFDDGEDAYPLVFAGLNGVIVSVNPARIPMGLVVRKPGLMNTVIKACFVRIGLALLKTRKPAARLRMIEHRCVLMASMIYDVLSITGTSRKVDHDTLLVLLDLRGMEQPSFLPHAASH
jgi:hypothetical protein